MGAWCWPTVISWLLARSHILATESTPPDSTLPPSADQSRHSTGCECVTLALGIVAPVACTSYTATSLFQLPDARKLAVGLNCSALTVSVGDCDTIMSPLGFCGLVAMAMGGHWGGTSSSGRPVGTKKAAGSGAEQDKVAAVCSRLSEHANTREHKRGQHAAVCTPASLDRCGRQRPARCSTAGPLSPALASVPITCATTPLPCCLLHTLG